MRRPLDDITVVAVEQAVAAPFATRQLAGLDARVIKVERPGGDFARGYDRTVHGRLGLDAGTLRACETGLVLSTGTPQAPAKAGISIADIATGTYAYSGILTALYDRERTGEGASLHVAMIDALGEWMQSQVDGAVPGCVAPA